MVAVRWAFALYGAYWGIWAVAALDVQRYLGFSDGELAALLAVTVVGGVLANGAGGSLAERHGTARVLRLAGLAWAASLLLTAVVTSQIAFCAVFVTAVAGGGLVDVAANIGGTAGLGAMPSRILRLHATFNLGALGGAAVAGVLLGAGWSFRWLWGGLGAAVLVLALMTRADGLPPTGPRAAGDDAELGRGGLATGFRALARAGLVPVAVAFALGAMVEGGLGSWGVLYLRSELGLAAAAGAGAYVVGQLIATAARTVLGETTDRAGPRRSVQVGFSLAAAGITAEAIGGPRALAAAGLAAAFFGIATYWPLLLAHASAGRERPAIIIGALSASGYLGFLAGTPIVGAVSGAATLGWGLAVLAVAAVGGTVALWFARPQPAAPAVSLGSAVAVPQS